ncbi:MAG: hypothetical protein GEEBNDBF_01635 [bacterium]|nr:hypothetical protein [bacterium]
MSRQIAATAPLALFLLGSLLLAPVQSAPLTTEDVARRTPADWTTIARQRVHNYDLPEQGIKLQLTLLDTELLLSLMPAMAAGNDDFPRDPETVAALLNAMKPHSRSMLLYMAVRDREAEPAYWSPIFGITKQSFVLRLAADANLTPFSNEVVSPVGFRVLQEKRPTEPNEAWRALYIIEFKSEQELADFQELPGLLLEYRWPQKPVYLNITSLRSEVKLDPDHLEARGGRPDAQLKLFFDHFPPRSAVSPPATSASE